MEKPIFNHFIALNMDFKYLRENFCLMLLLAFFNYIQLEQILPLAKLTKICLIQGDQHIKILPNAVGKFGSLGKHMEKVYIPGRHHGIEGGCFMSLDLLFSDVVKWR
jgi:hypothetical protein